MRASIKLSLFVSILLFFVSATAQAVINPWTSTGSLGTARSDHTATLLPNGKVLVVGGTVAGTTAELFDPAANTWAATTGPSNVRVAHTATLLASGKVLVVGGFNSVSGALSSAELYDPVSDSWSSTGSLASARSHHTATLLASGKVLVVGGSSGVAGGYLASAELYDPAAGTWSTAGALATTRELHAATLLSSGKVLVTGGFGGTGGTGGTASFLSAAELYDPVANAWSAAGNTTARARHSATLLATGKMLAFGGDSSGGAIATPELYDPAAPAVTAWSAAGTGPGTLPNARHDHSATLLPSGRLLIAGGYNAGYLDDAVLYDPVANTWKSGGHLVAARSVHTATLLPTGRVLVAAGADGSGVLASAELYEPAADASAAAGAMSSARTIFPATLLSSGKLLVAGGSGTAGVLALTELYDPVPGTWSTAAPMSKGRYSHTMTLLPSGRALVTGGFGNGTGPLAHAELYDPTANGWKATTIAMPSKRADHTATLLASGKVLLSGGYDGTAALATSVLYDPATDSWTDQGNLGVARNSHTATLLPSGKVLVVGGSGSGGASLASAELYDPASHAWTATATAPATRSLHTATLLPSGKVLVVGGIGGAILNTAQLYDPATDGWSATGNLSTGRYNHTATLLPSGKVLVCGGIYNTGTTPALAAATSCEIYDPGSGLWTPGSALATPHTYATAALLATGKVLVVGGYAAANSSTPTNAVDVYDPGLAPDAARVPNLSAVSAFLLQPTAFASNGLAATATGSSVDATTGATIATGFRPPLEAGAGAGNSSASNAPVLQVQRLDNGQMRFIGNDESVDGGDTNFTGRGGLSGNPLAGFPAGPVLVRAWVNGVPSAARYSSFAVTPGKPTPVATGGALHASVAFAEVDDGGAPVTYSIAASPGGVQTSCHAPCTGVAFDPMAPDVYTFTMLAYTAAGYGAASAPSNSITVTQAQTTVTIATLGSPTAPGASANFTAVLNNAVNPTGNVYFCADPTSVFDCTGGIPLCTVAASTGTMACSTSALSAGSHQIMATYPGDTDNLGSASRLTQLVGTAPAITSANTATFTIGVAGSFTVTTSGAPTSSINAGAVTFPVGITFVDHGDGTATFAGTPAADSAGTYSVTLHAQNMIPPDAVQTFTLTVVRAAQTLTFPPQSPSSHAFSAGGTFAISPLASSATPNSGNPIVYSSQTAGTCSVAGTTVTMLAIGQCTIAADQVGTADYYAAAATVTQNVAIGLAAQTVSFGPAQNVAVGTTGNVTATTTATPAANYPITFATTSTDCSLGAAGAVTGIHAGTNNCVVIATQAGDASYAAASATQTLSIARKSTTVALSVTPNPATVSVPVTLTATVAGDPPTGAVTFCEGAATADAACTGGKALCTSFLVASAANSTAVCSVSFASPGTHPLTAYYAGDGDYLAVSSPSAFALAVNSASAPAVAAPLDRRAMLLLVVLIAAIGAFVGARVRRRS